MGDTLVTNEFILFFNKAFLTSTFKIRIASHKLWSTTGPRELPDFCNYCGIAILLPTPTYTYKYGIL